MPGIARLRNFARDMTQLVERHFFDPATGQPREFVSGYRNRTLPNLWDRSREARA